MAFALTKALQTERDTLTSKLRDAATELASAIEAYNAAMEEQQNEVKEAQDTYNNALAELRVFRDERVEQWRGEYDERSEKWQESDKGGTVSSWLEGWEGMDLDDIEVTLPDEIDEPDMNHASEFEELQESASEV